MFVMPGNLLSTGAILKKPSWLKSFLFVAFGLLAISRFAVATPLDADAQVLAASPALQQLLPTARDFVLESAATIELRAVDLGSPAPLTTLYVIVTRGGERVARLTAAGSLQFSAPAGSYKVHVIGSVAGTTPGSFSVEVRRVATNASLLAFSDDITPPGALPADAAVSDLDDAFTITQAGSYTITITDRNLPVALSSIDLAVVQLGGGGGLIGASTGPCTPTCVMGPFNLAAAQYEIGGSVTAAGADKSGLYSIAVAGGPSQATVYGKTLPVGLLAAGQAVTLAAAGGTLTLTDLANPAALASLQSRLVQGANLVGTLSAAGTANLAGAAAGAGQLFVFARAGGAGAGAYALRLVQGSAVFEDARPLPEGYSAAANRGGYRFQTTIPSAGNYNLQLRDYAFPTGFTALRALVVQAGALVGTVPAAGSTAVALAAGPATLLVFGTPPGATANSLFGFALTAQAGTVPVLEQSQGVGGLFRSRTVTITAPGAYDLTLDDMQTPAGFNELALALTQGPTLKGQIFGGGTLPFTVPAAGEYTVNILARLGIGTSYGSYGFELATTPPVPTITLSANPAAVPSGQTSSLQWSSTNATACTASSGWTGAKATSGTETTVALTAATTYSLTCSGPGGSATAAVAVTISPPAASGGGGSLDAWLLALAAALLSMRVGRAIRP